MRLFRASGVDHPTTGMLRNMEQGRFVDALRALRGYREGPLPPPHALARLGRWHLERGKPKHAALPLRLFLDLYPAHQDGPEVKRDLANALAQLGRTGEARGVLREAASEGMLRDGRRRTHAEREALLAGRGRRREVEG